MGKPNIFITGIILIFIMLSSFSFVSAGFFDFFRKGPQLSPNQPLGVNITVGNTAPQIIFVDVISPVDITEDSIVAVTFSFLARDVDGASNLNDASATASFNRSGEVTRSNPCSLIGVVDSTTKNYSCTINIWYFDGAGTWIINATIADNNGLNIENTTTGFTLNPTTAIQMSPGILTWNPLSIIDRNQTSNNDPLLLNNTGNDNNLGVNITAIDLKGETTTTEYIFAGNFTIDIETGGVCSGASCIECDGTRMVNETTKLINGAVLPKGNHSINDGSTGQEQLYFCMTALNAISSQSYSTAGGGTWTVLVSVP